MAADPSSPGFQRFIFYSSSAAFVIGLSIATWRTLKSNPNATAPLRSSRHVRSLPQAPPAPSPFASQVAPKSKLTTLQPSPFAANRSADASPIQRVQSIPRPDSIAQLESMEERQPSAFIDALKAFIYATALTSSLAVACVTGVCSITGIQSWSEAAETFRNALHASPVPMPPMTRADEEEERMAEESLEAAWTQLMQEWEELNEQ